MTNLQKALPMATLIKLAREACAYRATYDGIGWDAVVLYSDEELASAIRLAEGVTVLAAVEALRPIALYWGALKAKHDAKAG